MGRTSVIGHYTHDFHPTTHRRSGRSEHTRWIESAPHVTRRTLRCFARRRARGETPVARHKTAAVAARHWTQTPPTCFRSKACRLLLTLPLIQPFAPRCRALLKAPRAAAQTYVRTPFWSEERGPYGRSEYDIIRRYDIISWYDIISRCCRAPQDEGDNGRVVPASGIPASSLRPCRVARTTRPVGLVPSDARVPDARGHLPERTPVLVFKHASSL